MKARITASLKATSPEEAQKLLNGLLSSLRSKGLIDDFSFEIDTASGVVTEKCILSGGKVIA